MVIGDPMRRKGPLPYGVPEGRRGDWFGSFDLQRAPQMTEARDACLKLLKGDLWCVFMIGGTGNGKTHLAIATLNEWSREGHYGQFWKVPDWLALMRSRVQPDEGQRNSEEVLSAFMEAPMLALDDLGPEKNTPWGDEQLYRLIDRRCDNRMRTIVTSNARKADLDPRIVSRLSEGMVVCRSPDVRGTVRGGDTKEVELGDT